MIIRMLKKFSEKYNSLKKDRETIKENHSDMKIQYLKRRIHLKE